MQYEIYIDSLFFLNFTMNLYLLILTDHSLGRVAPKWRIFAGATLGSAAVCLLYLLPLPLLMARLYAAAVLVCAALMGFVFRPKGMRAFLKVLKKGIVFTFLLGGAMGVLQNYGVPFTMWFVMGVGGALWLIFLRGMDQQKGEENRHCQVMLPCEGSGFLAVEAIVDTGNSLYEPISGKPVSVLDGEIFAKLGDMSAKGFRAIPYRSVGCERGIMKGYELPQMIVEKDGISKAVGSVFVGVSERPVSVNQEYRMLLHPAVLEEK